MKKLWLLSGVCMAVLTACGGGGGDNKVNGVDISSTSSPNSLTVTAGASANIESFIRAKGASISSSAWSIESTNGAKLDANSPQVADAACANAVVVAGGVAVGNAGSTPGEARCSTNVVVPTTATNGSWKLVSTSKSSTGYTGLSEIPLTVVAQTPTSLNFTVKVNDGKYVGTTALNTAATLKGSFSVVTTRPESDFQFTTKWTQVSGPTVATQETAGTDISEKDLTFTPTVKGEYVFKYTVSFTAPVAETKEATFVAVVTEKTAN